MLKTYLQLSSTLIKFLNIKSIIVLKMEAINMIKKWQGKNMTKSHLLMGEVHEDFL